MRKDLEINWSKASELEVIMFSYLGILLIPLAILCFMQVRKELKSGKVKTRVGYRTSEHAPVTFWLSIIFESFVGVTLLIVGGMCLWRALK